jgi:hypothetical protein
MMQVIIERCAGLDVHQETVVACVLAGTPGQRPTKEIRTFCTMTRDLEALRDWLKAAGVTHVGMESTGGLLAAGLCRSSWAPAFGRPTVDETSGRAFRRC